MMKKRNLMPTVKKTAKSAFALSLAATMAMPAGVSVAAADVKDDGVVVPEPIKVYDFNEGLQEIMETDDNFSITQSEELYFQKTPEEVGKTETVDANGLVYVGSGSTTRYHKGIISNQPTTVHDAEKGTVLQIGKTQTVPAVYKTQPAGITDAEGSAKLDEEIPASGVAIQEEKVINSEIVISNPYGSEELAAELREFSEFDTPTNDGKTWKKWRGSRYQPVWKKGVTVSYWIKVPSEEVNGQKQYKPSSVLRWELLDQELCQADDYAKHLACLYWDEEPKVMGYTEQELADAKLNESKVIYGSEYYYKYLEYKYNDDGTIATDEDGAPLPEEYTGSAFTGPVYDGRFLSKTDGYELSWYYQYNPNFKRGYTRLADGSYEAQDSNIVGADPNHYALYSTLDIDKGSYVRRADVDGELQIDVDNSIFWVSDDNQGINKNPNHKASYLSKAGMQNGDVFFMNSWLEGQEMNASGDGYTYQSANSWAISPVTDIKDYNEEDGTYTGVPNGNVDEWHQVTVTLQNDWVEFYVDGIKADVDTMYASRGGKSLDNTESFKRINKGTGLRYGWGAEKGAVNFSYGNYVCKLLMDWITDEDALLHIGGAGQYAKKYAQAYTSCEFSLDDLKFYDVLLTEDQIVQAYKDEVADMKAVSTAADAKNVSFGVVTDASVEVKDAVKTVTDKINGTDVKTINVAANGKFTTATGAQLVNPFAGKELEGATIGYWVKQADTKNPSVLAFFDTEKEIYDPKNDGGEASSILYVQNDGKARFEEGYTDAGIAGQLKNSFQTDNTTAAAVMLEDSVNWNYVTITMDNTGIKYYVDGKLVENGCANPTGPRFHDGFFQRLEDEASVESRFGMFGGTNNQCATTLMDFITSEDTGLYLNYFPMAGGKFTKTSGASYAAIKYVDAALTDAEVANLYAKSLENLDDITITPGPTDTPDVVAGSGDVDGNGEIKLPDAQATLKIALKITTNATSAQLAAADVNGDGAVNLTDAQLILKYALKIITSFK